MILKKLGFTNRNKIKTTTLIFSVLCLILLTNLQERMMIKRLNETVTSIYEDRVVVGNYILQLSNYIEEIVQSLKSNPSNNSYLINLLSKIDSINIAYDKTFLTEKEKINFIQFTQISEKMKKSIENGNITDALNNGSQAENILRVLSSIQVEEGKDKLDEVLAMTNTRSILSYLEIVIIIVISILIQKIILSTKPLIIKKTENDHNLN
ncbi:MCP four helix bundle domain-containing protein [Sphingobacterium cavernae]|uniref:hypothetical protein n=1 Tax=Sphingobacterium cavernae TaxID=2592657 RepID=UPI00123016B3|nr:hypothetical protein [Sphingobacterium cavernae]